jgi:anti-anti-sigma factor
MALTIRTRQTKTGVITLTPKGSIDTETCEILDKTMGRILTEPVKALVLDMEGVDLITSAGIGTIMKAKTSLARKGGDLVLTNLQPQVEKVFEIVRLLPTLGVFQNQKELDEYLEKIQRRITGDED